jgi:hypothetical protein
MSIITSGKTKQSTNPNLPIELETFSTASKEMVDRSITVQNSPGNEDGQVPESTTVGPNNPSTRVVLDQKKDGTQQQDNILGFDQQFNGRLLEDHYQQFMRGWHGGMEAQDGDDASSRGSSSGRRSSYTEPLTSGSHSSTNNGKRRIDETSIRILVVLRVFSIASRRTTPKRPRKTAEEKQTELRCTEFAAGRQTTAKCLTYSTRDLHRLKSVCTIQRNSKRSDHSSYHKRYLDSC